MRELFVHSLVAKGVLSRAGEPLLHADAHYTLGAIAESRGDIATALEHYGVAAGSGTPAGQAAEDAMVRLDLPRNPSRYLQVATYTDTQGQLVVQVGNPTGVAVGNLVLTINYVDPGGAIRRTNRVLNRSLAPGTLAL